MKKPNKVLIILFLFATIYMTYILMSRENMQDYALAKNQMTIPERAEYISKLIQQNKGWGGHSPIPSYVVTDDTFQAVKKVISIDDSPALILVLQDDDYGIRSIAADLLECINPNAKSEIEKAMATETSSERRDRLGSAIIDIDTIKAGGTSCK